MQAESAKPYEGGFFMSEEQEAAANWQMFETYKKLSGRHATLSNQVRQWAVAMQQLGNALSGNPAAVASMHFSGIPKPEELEAAKTEMLSFVAINRYTKTEPPKTRHDEPWMTFRRAT